MRSARKLAARGARADDGLTPRVKATLIADGAAVERAQLLVHHRPPRVTALSRTLSLRDRLGGGCEFGSRRSRD